MTNGFQARLFLKIALSAVSILILSFDTTGVGASTGEAKMNRYAGYSWPVAPGCTQRLERNPNFGNSVRLRADGTTRPHLGVDVAPPDYDLLVYAANAGAVAENSPARGSGWGNYVVIQHKDGLRTLYGHLVTQSRLRVGSAVAKGDIIGTAGQTETSYVHLHLEVLAKSASGGWTKGRLDPAAVIGPLMACRNSAAPQRDHGAASMRTILFLLAGVLLAIGAAVLGRLFSPNYPGASVLATTAFVALWLAIAGFNLWIGVTRAGYSIGEELPIFLLVFGVPALVAILLKWKLI